MSGWLQTALDRVRDFAYAVPPPIEAPGAPPKIGLALGGGFARGIAHLGVLHALQQNNIPIHCIAGTSAGALAAVAYASGLPFDEVVRKATALKFGNFAQWRFSKMGLASNQRLALYPQLTLGVSDFKELKIPLVIVAADLYTGEPVYMSEGPIGPALRASCAYPGIVPPGGISRTPAGGWICGCDGAGGCGAVYGRRHRDCGVFGWGKRASAEQYYRRDRAVVRHRAAARGLRVAGQGGRGDRAECAGLHVG